MRASLSSLRAIQHLPRIALSLGLVACGADSIISVGPDGRSRSIDAAVGQEIRIALGNVGPAEYETPPQVSSTVVTYVGVEVVPPYTPAGPTERFSFKVARPGVAIIKFRRLLDGSIVSAVEDTIIVR